MSSATIKLVPSHPYEDLLLNAPAAIARMRGPEHRFEFVNPFYERLVHGRPTVGRTIREVFPELEGQPFFGLLDRVYQTGEPFYGNEMLARFDRRNEGTLDDAYFNFVYYPTRDAGGRVDGVIALAHEVTELVRARKEAEAAEQRFRGLVQGLPDVIVWEADAATVDFQFVSPSAETLLGFPVQAWYDERPNFWVNHLHPEDRDRCVTFCKNETAQGRDHEFEYRMIAADGRVVWLRDRAYVVRDEQGRISKLRGLMIDITRQKAQEEEIRRFNETLENKVRDRTTQLEDALRELESFSYSVSHDLRAPIRHIGGFAEMLEKNAGASLDTKGRHYLGTIREAATRAGQLVDDLLAFSRMGRADLKRDRVELPSVVAEVRRELEPEMGGRMIDLTVGELPTVNGDPAMLRLVLRNLLGNAVKFTRANRRARIEIGSRREGGEHVVWVRDDGVGFDMAHADKLFGVFQRLHAAEEFEGNGIGLATVRRVVSRHGGRTWAESKAGKGATFYFSLPAVDHIKEAT